MASSATVKGGFFPEVGVPTLTQISTYGGNTTRRRIAQLLRRKGVLELRARMDALNGVAPGATAAATQGRIEANTELGGKRTIETQTLINRATTAADVTEIDTTVLNALYPRTSFGANPVANKDGNPLGTR